MATEIEEFKNCSTEIESGIELYYNQFAMKAQYA